MDESVSYYFSGTVPLKENEATVLSEKGCPEIDSRLSGAILSGMGVFEVERIWFPRRAGTFEYNLPWDLVNPLNLSLPAGGLGVHHYI